MRTLRAIGLNRILGPSGPHLFQVVANRIISITKRGKSKEGFGDIEWKVAEVKLLRALVGWVALSTVAMVGAANAQPDSYRDVVLFITAHTALPSRELGTCTMSFTHVPTPTGEIDTVKMWLMESDGNVIHCLGNVECIGFSVEGIPGGTASGIFVPASQRQDQPALNQAISQLIGLCRH